MVYPIVVVSVAVAIVALLMVVVVPKFQSIFEDMLEGKALPAPTQLVINISNLVGDNIVLSIILFVLVFFGFKFLGKTTLGAKAFNWSSINFPKVGDLVRKVNIARITRTFGTCFPVVFLSCRRSTSAILRVIHFSLSLTRVHDSVRDGEPLAKQMDRETVFPTWSRV